MVYSLMPAPTLEDAITLRRRILDRLRENASLLGSDEQFFGREEERAVIMGLYDEHSDYRLDEEEIDPVSMAYQIWRTAEQKYPDLAEQAKSMPNVVYSTKSAPANAGLVVHSQASLGSDAFAFVPRNGPPRRISPQEALRRSACQPNTTPAPRLTGHFEMIASALRGPLKAPPPEQLMARQGGVIGKCWRRLSRHREIHRRGVEEASGHAKEITNPRARWVEKPKDRPGHRQRNFTLAGSGEVRFSVYLRQNLYDDADFSCGILLIPHGRASLTLARYNGSSHPHGDILYRPHIHRATEKAIAAGRKPESEAEETKRYTTLNGALACLIDDFNISGIQAKHDEPSMVS